MSNWQSQRPERTRILFAASITETTLHYGGELPVRAGRPRPRNGFVPITLITAAVMTIEVRCPSRYIVSLANAGLTTLRRL